MEFLTQGRWFLLTALVAMGCRKDPEVMEAVLVETIDLNDVYGTRMAGVALGSDYGQQAYFSLAENRVVAQHDRYAWDVALTHEAEPALLLNHAIPGLRVAVAGPDWTEWVDETELVWAYDLPTGDAADWAVGRNWAGQTLVLDRGLDATGAPRGYLKFQVTCTDSTQHFRIADLSGAAERQFTAPTDTVHHATEWSLDGGPLHLAPPRADWDLLFTNYLHVYEPETDPFPYQVTGALLNPWNHRGGRFEGTDFAEFALTAELEPALTPAWDAIGFDWKSFDFDLGYTVYEELTFAVDCGATGRYALAFTGFYDEQGERGAPQFQFRRLME